MSPVSEATIICPMRLLRSMRLKSFVEAAAICHPGISDIFETLHEIPSWRAW
jgi:hypothetical protein